MEILIYLISIFLLIILILNPYLLYRLQKNKRVKFSFFSMFISVFIVSSLLIFLFGWWYNLSYEILLTHYNYDFEAMNDMERYLKIVPENLERVKEIEKSLFGISWPLKSLFLFVSYIPIMILTLLYFNKKLAK